MSPRNGSGREMPTFIVVCSVLIISPKTLKFFVIILLDLIGQYNLAEPNELPIHNVSSHFHLDG